RRVRRARCADAARGTCRRRQRAARRHLAEETLNVRERFPAKVGLIQGAEKPRAERAAAQHLVLDGVPAEPANDEAGLIPAVIAGPEGVLADRNGAEAACAEEIARHVAAEG